MKVNKVDKNFDTTFECPSDIKWHSVLNKPFSIHGVIYSKEEGLRLKKKSVYDYYCTKKGMSKEDAKANYLYIRTIVNLSAIHGKEITL